MMFERRRLGSVYMKSPAQKIRALCTGFAAKIVFSIIYCLIFYLSFRFVIVAVVNFLLTEIALKDAIPPGNPIWVSIEALFMLGIIIFVFKERATNR